MKYSPKFKEGSQAKIDKDPKVRKNVNDATSIHEIGHHVDSFSVTGTFAINLADLVALGNTGKKEAVEEVEGGPAVENPV